MAGAALSIAGREREQFGYVVSFENADGRRLVRHVKGKARAALPEACAWATALDDSFRVVCISSPESIYMDLQGRPLAGAMGRDVLARTPWTSEVQQLRWCGLAHMAHPRLLGVSRGAVNRRRQRDKAREQDA